MCGLDGKWEDFYYYGGSFWQNDDGTLTAKAVTFPIDVNIALDMLILCRGFMLYV